MLHALRQDEGTCIIRNTMNEYLVPKENIRIESFAKNSRFIASVSRTSSVEEAKKFIETIRHEMPDATHHVYAFRIGFGASVTEGMSDDGEPSGTAGPPVLTILRGSDIGDVTLVVTRYFGGTKLGTGGLVSAYSGAAKLALSKLQTERKIDKTQIRFSIPYSSYNAVSRILEENTVHVLHEDFGSDVQITADIPTSSFPTFQQSLNDLLSCQLEIDIVDS